MVIQNEQVQTCPDKNKLDWTGMNKSRAVQKRTSPDSSRQDQTWLDRNEQVQTCTCMKFWELLSWNSKNYKYEILRITNMKFWELQWPSLYKETRHVQGVQCSAGCHSLLLYFYTRITRHPFGSLKFCRCEPECQLLYQGTKLSIND